MFGGSSGQLWKLTGVGIALFLRATHVAAHPGVFHDIERVSAALEKQPDRVDLLIERGVYFQLAESYKLSLADFDKAAQLDLKNLDIAAHRGTTLAAMGRNADAEREFTRFLDGGRVSAAVLAERAAVRVKLEQLEEAIGDFTKSLAISPNVDSYLERSKLEESLGRLDRAASGLREGLAALGGAVVLRERLIEIEVRYKDFDGAIRSIDDQLAVTPIRTEWYLRRADILATAGKTSDAHRDLTLALDEANRSLSLRTSAIHLVSRAKVYLALKRFDDAKKDLQSALEQAPRMDEARAMLEQVNANPGTESSTIEKRGRK